MFPAFRFWQTLLSWLLGPAHEGRLQWWWFSSWWCIPFFSLIWAWFLSLLHFSVVLKRQHGVVHFDSKQIPWLRVIFSTSWLRRPRRTIPLAFGIGLNRRLKVLLLRRSNAAGEIRFISSFLSLRIYKSLGFMIHINESVDVHFQRVLSD